MYFLWQFDTISKIYKLERNTNMLQIGAHLTIAKGYTQIGKQALSIGANTFQFFTRNPRGAKAKKLDVYDIQGLQKLLQENHFAPIIAHSPYTMNLASDKEEIRQIGKEMMLDDLKRLEHLPGNLYNFHPGSHVGMRSRKRNILYCRSTKYNFNEGSKHNSITRNHGR